MIEPEDLTSNATKPFLNGQRLKRPPLSWSVWVCRNIVFLFIKFMVLLAFYSMHKHHDRVHNDHDGAEFGSIHNGLAEFRRESRVSSAFLRSRKSNETDAVPNFYWSRLALPCSSSVVDPFPLSFDPVYYQAEHNKDYDQYVANGRAHGEKSSRGQELRKILATEIVPLFSAPVLEIGPFINPLLRGGDTEYFDVADWEGLVRKADELDYIVSPDPVDITHVRENGDLSTLEREAAYSLIVSSHVLTVQTDFVSHLRSVSRLLKGEGGYYIAFVSDKRYGQEHFVQETSIAEVLDDFHSERRTPKLLSLIENMALQAPSKDLKRQWQGDFGKLPYSDSEDPVFLEHLRRAVETHQSMDKSAVNMDVPQYHFTPHTLAIIIDALYTMGLTDLRVHQLYDTVFGSEEFSIVLKKCPSAEA